MKIILLGPPGAGKGTQAKSICGKYSLIHISTGDIFRKNISENTPLGIKAKKDIDMGKLVSDEVTIFLVQERLKENDCNTGYLLDGFPRTVVQAEALDNFLMARDEELDAVLLIDVPKQYIIDRMSGRRVCTSCGASYHIVFNPPNVEGKCNYCGSCIQQRADDMEDTVRRRLEIYDLQTQPLIDYYNKKGKLVSIDGTKSIDDVFDHICKVLGRDIK